MYAVPLHEVAGDGGLEWAASARFSRGVPDQVSEPWPLPSVTEVLNAFRSAGCHGTAWFEVGGVDAVEGLPGCPDPGTCGSAGGLDLGEVGLGVAGRVGDEQSLPAQGAVERMSFRKPVGAAVLHAVCALTPLAGPQLVFDDSADQVFVLWPGERIADVVKEWPW